MGGRITTAHRHERAINGLRGPLDVGQVAIDLDDQREVVGAARQPARAGVVDEVVAAVRVAPDVDPWEGLLDVPATKGLDPVMLVVMGP